MPSSDDRDKRGQSRQQYVHFAWYKRIDEHALESEEGVARSCDVSGNGIGMITTRSLSSGSRLFVELVGHAGRISALGTVMHCSDAGNSCFRIGIRVDLLPPTDRVTWSEMVKS